MFRILSVLFAVLIAGWVLGGTASDANAGFGHRCCRGKTVYKDVTRYHSTVHTNYVQRYYRVAHAQWIQPVTRVHVVNIIHERTVPVWHPVIVCVPRWLPPRVEYVSAKVIHVWY